jgi:hypothetical protein
MFRGRRYRRLLCAALIASMMLGGTSGCHLWEVSHEPVVHNPFPQLSRVAVAPFFNQSDEPTVDGREFALAYFAELQATPGFEVVPLGVVEEAILQHQVDLSDAGEARRLAAILNVDAVVIGSVTDFTPYYPPRCGMRVEWYAANAGFHEIPPGYGLPWGTPEEEFIPRPLVFEAEFALAKAEFASKTPNCPKPPLDPPQRTMTSEDEPQLFNPTPQSAPSKGESPHSEQPGDDPSSEETSRENENADGTTTPPQDDENTASDSEITDTTLTAYEEEVVVEQEEQVAEELPLATGSGDASIPLPPQTADGSGTTGATGPHCGPSRGASVAGSTGPPPCVPYNGPVMTHTRIYSGNDGDFTEALANYYHFRNDARFGGWQNYLQRSDDFIRFCCHMHICEMLSARGGADQTRVEYRWSDCR